MLEFLTAAISLLIVLFKEYFSASARAREEKKAFEMNESTFRELVQSSLLKLRLNARSDSAAAGSAWDAQDQEKRGRE